ncbi:hypothetical protein [Psychroserpens jangbogonensis]|uniref:hypothetical protein n=1 Tax=Psychroserpens jangbogonensis TaxID=1484460 RepID=UPI00053E41D5|nr:hypothetical protein [Psychroserpens jangbogonensis]
MKQILYFLVFLFFLITAEAQDTIFVKSLNVSNAKNVTTDNKDLYFRMDNKLYYFNLEKDKPIEQAKGNLKYSWLEFNSDSQEYVVMNSNYIPLNRQINCKYYENIIPGFCNKQATVARVNNNLFICLNGKILQYRIDTNYKIEHKGRSIRHVFSEPGRRIISTYSGVFSDSLWTQFSNIKIKGDLEYSNGELSKINGNYYLCQDDLLKLNINNSTFENVLATENGPRTRKLVDFKGVFYAMYNSALGIIDLDNSINNKILINDDFTDIQIHQNKLYACSTNGNLYIIDSKGSIDVYTFDYSFNDINIDGSEIYLGTKTNLVRLNENLGLDVVFKNEEVIQLMFLDDSLLFTNNRGFHIFLDGQINTIIDNIEFNKFALNFDDNYIYAGSVNGLYIIETSTMREVIIPNLLDKIYIKNDSSLPKYAYSIITFSLSIIIIILSFWFVLKRGKEKNLKQTISSEIITQIIEEKPKVKSVDNLAEYLNTSVVQINRNLKKENTTALKILIIAKKKIARDMLKQGASIKDISKRVGYSERYVKEKLIID